MHILKFICVQEFSCCTTRFNTLTIQARVWRCTFVNWSQQFGRQALALLYWTSLCTGYTLSRCCSVLVTFHKGGHTVTVNSFGCLFCQGEQTYKWNLKRIRPKSHVAKVCQLVCLCLCGRDTRQSRTLGSVTTGLRRPMLKTKLRHLTLGAVFRRDAGQIEFRKKTQKYFTVLVRQRRGLVSKWEYPLFSKRFCFYKKTGVHAYSLLAHF